MTDLAAPSADRTRDADRLSAFIGKLWDEEVTPTLVDYIKIPNKSPSFDPDWAAHGHMDKVVAMFEAWARRKIAPLAGATLEVVRLEGRTPVILIDIPGQGSDCVLLYGHLDKQPEMTGWSEGLGPWTPVIRGDKLYGRGGADDGYAMFGAISAILALRDAGRPHARCVILIEACEESGSPDLPYYVDHLGARLGDPSLVVCLDSGCGDYERMWLTTSLRGLMSGALRVQVLDEGVHSGDASGVVPSSFRILRQLLSRLEDEDTGRILPGELYSPIPAQRAEQAQMAAKVLGQDIWAKFPFVAGMRPVADDLGELVLNRTWRPTVSIIGIDGVPAMSSAGNVLRPFTSAKLSIRLPPTCSAKAAAAAVKRMLEADPPYGAKVEFNVDSAEGGWNAPQLAPWLEAAVARASQDAFGHQVAYMGEGGSIPFMGMLGEKFPEAQFVITGVLGPHSNAHGPNEFLHIPTGKRVSTAVALILADHFNRPSA
jgi:acetylornithine deacetylase/succinyl-diaminopimelate desuccinylase-like protein